MMGLLVPRVTKTFFFIGYSLRDPNFQQVFGRIARMLSDARRPAFATSFEAKGAVALYLREQWQEQQLELITIEGATLEEQKQQFVRFLDALADAVAMDTAPLVLTSDVPVSEPLKPLREALQKVGEQVELLREAKLEDKEYLFLGEMLRFLTEHGWRPSRGSGGLCRLWEELAHHISAPDERKRMLIAALSSAETLIDVRRIREQLDKRDPAEKI